MSSTKFSFQPPNQVINHRKSKTQPKEIKYLEIVPLHCEPRETAEEGETDREGEIDRFLDQSKVGRASTVALVGYNEEQRKSK